MKRPKLEVDLGELDRLLEQATAAPITTAESDKIKTALHAMAELIEARRKQQQQRSSEKTATVFPETAKPEPEEEEKKKAPGHGRIPASAYTAAERVAVEHPELKHGGPCPECPKGKVYTQKEPKVLVRLTGQAPVAATVYQLERLRCNACGQVFTAPPPEGVGAEKYDAAAAAMMAVLKYGHGVPMNRLEALEGMLGTPLPASTQWEVMDDAGEVLRAARDELIRQAAQGEVVYNDDTGNRILKMERPVGDARTGTFTTAIVSNLAGGRRVTVFSTGWRHAGENLAELLKERARELGPPVQMCDALSRNLPKGVETLLANCLSHGRRDFVALAETFPAECKHVLVELGKVYEVDGRAKQEKLSKEARLELHQRESGPVMEALAQWCDSQFAQKLVEPNSSLGQAIQYLRNHWKKLTVFLRVAGAPLDNNVCEQALKRVVLHRKNAMFYKTMHGAETADVFMSLIHTCAQNQVEAFTYLTELLDHPLELRADPAAWMPWNFHQRVAAA